MSKTATKRPVNPHMIEIPPNAARTLEALREMGYDSFSAIADLIDNSIDANATRIEITIKAVGDGITVDVLDDGRGMDDETLSEALRLGSRVEAYDPKKRLGKFGMGLVTASLSMAQNIWIISRAEGKPAFEAVLDMDVIRHEDRFVINLRPASGKHVGETVQQRGTFVRLSKIDRATDTNVSRFAQNLRTRIGQIYRHYLKNGLTIVVNSRNVRRHDPLMLDHPQIDVKLDTDFDLFDGTKAHLTVVELPDLGTEGDAAAGIAPHNSGFYVVRNGREIIQGETFGLYRHHHSYSHFRAEISYHGDSTAFHEDVKKSSVQPDDRFRDRLDKLTKKYIEDSGRQRRERAETPIKLSHKGSTDLIALAAAKTPGKKANHVKLNEEKGTVEPPKPLVQFEVADLSQPDSPLFFESDEQDGSLVIRYNQRHPLVRYASEASNPKAHALLDLFTYAIARTEEQVPETKKVMKELSKVMAELTAPGIT